jgi:hypothetical protein
MNLAIERDIAGPENREGVLIAKEWDAKNRMNTEELLNLLIQAMNETAVADDYLFRVDASERNLAGRLGIHLQPKLPDWHVDPEYNRMAGNTPKRIYLPPECAGYRNEDDLVLVSPDLIVHRRGPEGPNLLVIELKKTTNRDKGACDRHRLLAFREQFGYLFGARLECETRPEAEPEMRLVDWFA